MIRRVSLISLCLAMLCVAGFAQAKEKKAKPGPLTGTWQCMSHGSSQGDMAFTLNLQQNKEAVTGSVEAPQGSADITTASFKKHTLDIQIDTDGGNYVVSGELKHGALSGTWSHGDEKGTWEGKKQAPSQ